MSEDFDRAKKLRKELKSGRMKPRPSGFIAAGKLPGGLPVRVQCADHIFRTTAAQKSDGWQSGWVQGAVCIVCVIPIDPRDASWWMRPASPEQIKRAGMFAKRESERLNDVYLQLKGMYRERLQGHEQGRDQKGNAGRLPKRAPKGKR